jgi:hypothetical protein
LQRDCELLDAVLSSPHELIGESAQVEQLIETLCM